MFLGSAQTGKKILKIIIKILQQQLGSKNLLIHIIWTQT